MKGITQETIDRMTDATGYDTAREAVVTSYIYDSKGQLLEEITALGTKAINTFDGVGNLVKHMDEGGYETSYEYDAVKQLKTVTYDDGKTVTYTYNSNKQQTSMTDWLGSNTYDLDILELVLQATVYEAVLMWAGANYISGMKLPQGITQEQFKESSSLIRSSVGDISDDIVVQGSRAGYTAKATSDIDYAIRVTQEQFDDIIKMKFGTPNPGSAKEKIMLHAISTGKIQSGEAGLRGLRKQLEGLLNMEVDISIILKNGMFDNGPMLPIQ